MLVRERWTKEEDCLDPDVKVKDKAMGATGLGHVGVNISSAIVLFHGQLNDALF